MRRVAGSGAVPGQEGQRPLAPSQRLASGTESCLDCFWSGLDQFTRTSDSGRNLLVAVSEGNHELSRLGVSEDVHP